jgi:hypothetical protein
MGSMTRTTDRLQFVGESADMSLCKTVLMSQSGCGFALYPVSIKI